MPFDIAPKVKTRFQQFADAMLLGCALSTPHRHSLWHDGPEAKRAACAIGAYYLGVGLPFGHSPGPLSNEANEVSNRYYAVYGDTIAGDNDNGPYTREQIAARVAAL